MSQEEKLQRLQNQINELQRQQNEMLEEVQRHLITARELRIEGSREHDKNCDICRNTSYDHHCPVGKSLWDAAR